jgi:hypothetical protein
VRARSGSCRRGYPPPAMPHFQFVTTDGTVRGTRELGRPDWPPGSVIYTGPDEPDLRVVDLMPADDPERQFTVLVVERAE